MIMLLSVLALALCDPLRFPILTCLCSVGAYGCFFKGLSQLQRGRRFWVATLLYALIQSVPFGWFATTTYHGPLIIVAYGLLLLLFGLQFGLFSLFLERGPYSVRRILALSGGFTLMEVMRLYLLAGYVWNAAGLLMTYHPFAMQLASFGGVFGLSFLVIFQNLCAMNALYERRWRLLWGASVVVPLALSAILYQARAYEGQKLNIAIVQPNFSIEQKQLVLSNADALIHPYKQWEIHFQRLVNAIDKKVDLIVFPESHNFFKIDSTVYAFEEIKHLMVKHFGEGVCAAFPKQEEGLMYRSTPEGGGVSNAFIVKTLANFFDADIVIGLDEELPNVHYNSAFFFSSKSDERVRYDKQLLVPISEYSPSKWLEKISAKYGIHAFFSHGKGAVIFDGKVKMSPSICYEECFGGLMRKGRVLGAEMLVNLTNDGWFPKSSLPHQHLLQVRLRSIEMGIPHVRASNTGSSALINSRGDLIAHLGNDRAEVGVASLDCATYTTPYTHIGDWGVIFLSLFTLTLPIFSRQKRDAQLHS